MGTKEKIKVVLLSLLVWSMIHLILKRSTRRKQVYREKMQLICKGLKNKMKKKKPLILSKPRCPSIFFLKKIGMLAILVIHFTVLEKS